MTVVSLPYLAAQVDMVTKFFTGGPGTSIETTAGIAQAATSGLITALPFAGLLVLIMLLAVLRFAPDEPQPVQFALGELQKRWRPIVASFALILLAISALLAAALAALGPLGTTPIPVDAGRQIALTFSILAIELVTFGVCTYLATRWAVAAPAFIVDHLTLEWASSAALD